MACRKSKESSCKFQNLGSIKSLGALVLHGSGVPLQSKVELIESAEETVLKPLNKCSVWGLILLHLHYLRLQLTSYVAMNDFARTGCYFPSASWATYWCLFWCFRLELFQCLHFIPYSKTIVIYDVVNNHFTGDSTDRSSQALPWFGTLNLYRIILLSILHHFSWCSSWVSSERQCA